MTAHQHTIWLAVVTLSVLACTSCQLEPDPDDRNQQVEYRTGTRDFDYTSNGERGNLQISEINWAGSVCIEDNGIAVYDPDDIFIEFQNRHPRPIDLTNWQITVRAGTGRHGASSLFPRNDKPQRTYLIPARENGRPVEPNEFIVVAAKRNRAFQQADYYIEDLQIPKDNFQIIIRDIDDRLIEGAGEEDRRPFSGSYDLVSVRSMERIQLIFANRGNNNWAWHTYSLNQSEITPAADKQALHESLSSEIAAPCRAFTLASPGRANSPDYSGNASAGDFD